MPLNYKIFSIVSTCGNSLLYFLLFQSMVIYDSHFWHKLYLCFFSTIAHMDMNRLMLVQIEKEPYSKGYKQCWHMRLLFFAKIVFFLYIHNTKENFLSVDTIVGQSVFHLVFLLAPQAESLLRLVA